jgi:hypothetical protein
MRRRRDSQADNYWLAAQREVLGASLGENGGLAASRRGRSERSGRFSRNDVRATDGQAQPAPANCEGVVISAVAQQILGNAIVTGEVDAPRWNRIASLRGGQQREVRMRLSALETALLTACVVLAVVVAYWGIKILAA